MRRILLVLVSTLLATFTVAAEAPYFSRPDGGYSGLYRLDHRIWAVIVPGEKPDTFRGFFEDGPRWDFEAVPSEGRLTGRAASGSRSAPVQIWFEGDLLRIESGRHNLSLHRVVEVDDALAYPEAPADVKPVKWTIAIYLGGDNDLEQAAVNDLREMRLGLPAEGVEVIVLADRAKEYSKEDGDWTGTRLLRIRPDGEPQLLKDYGELDTSSPVTLASFLTGAFNTFPSEKTAAFIWNHGGGWTGIVQDEDIPGQPGADSMLSLLDVRVALRTALISSQRRKLDLVVFDACLMAQLEVALQMSDLASYMVASEANVPGRGMPYDTVLPLFALAELGPREISMQICDRFHESYEAIDYQVTTISALDLSKVEAVAEPVSDVALIASTLGELTWPAVLRSAYYSESYNTRETRMDDSTLPSVDIIDFINRLEACIPPVLIEKLTSRVRKAVGEAVLNTRNGDYRRGSNGLAIFAPRTAAQNIAGYRPNSPIGRNNRWMELFDTAHAKAAERKDEPVSFSDVLVRSGVREGRPFVRPFDGDSMEFTVTGNTLIAVTRADMVQEDENTYIVLRRSWVPDPDWMSRARQSFTDLPDLFMPQFKDGENNLSVELTGQRFRFSNGESTVNLSLVALDPSPGAPYTSRARIYPASGAPAFEAEVIFDPVHWIAVAAVELRIGKGGLEPRAFIPQPEDEIAFLLETLHTDGKQTRTETDRMRWGKTPVLLFGADDPGEYVTSIIVRTLDGREFDTQAAYAVEENPALAEWAESWKQFDPETFGGAWRRSVVLNDGMRETGAVSYVGEAIGGIPTLRSIETEVTLDGKEETLNEIWLFRADPVPTLRIIQRVIQGPDLCWYGPVSFGERAGTPYILMKNMPMGGVLWHWERSRLLELKIRKRDS